MPATAHRFHHGGSVREFAFTSDGRYVVSSDDDRRLRVFDRKTGCLVTKRRMGHLLQETDLVLSPDDRYVIARDGGSKAHAKPTPMLLPNLKPKPVGFLRTSNGAFSADGTRLAAADDFLGTFVFPVPLTKPLKAGYVPRPPKPDRHSPEPGALDVVWTGPKLAILYNDCKIRIHSPDLKLRSAVQAHKHTNINSPCLRLQAWGRRLLSVGAKPMLALTDPKTAKSSAMIQAGSASRLAVHPTEPFALTSQSKSLYVVDLAKRRIVQTITSKHRISEVGFADEGATAAWGEGHRLRTAPFRSGRIERQKPASDTMGGFVGIDWSVDGKVLYGLSKHHLQTFDPKTGAGPIVSLPLESVPGQNTQVLNSDYDHAKHFYSVKLPGGLRLFGGVRLTDGTHRWVATLGYKTGLSHHGFDPANAPMIDGDDLTGYGDALAVVKDKQLSYWRVGQAKVRTFQLPHKPSHIAISRDGTRIAVLSTRQLHVVDVDSGVSQITKHGVRIRAVAFHPARKDVLMIGYRAGSGGDPEHTLAALSLRTRKLRWTARVDGGVNDLSFSPDGELLAVAGEDMQIRVLTADEL